MFKKIFGRTKLYRVASYLYDLYVKHELLTTDTSKIRHFGHRAEIFENVQITHPGRTWIGDWTKIYGGTVIGSMGGVHIGNYVGIGYGCTILTFIHNYRKAKSVPFDDKVFLKPVIIRDLAWLGWRTQVYPGVEIGEGAICSMGSVVTRNVPRLAIVAGNPAEVIGYRSEEHYEACLEDGRVNSHRLLEFFEEFDEQIPLMTRKRYARELVEMGLMEEPAESSAAAAEDGSDDDAATGRD